MAETLPYMHGYGTITRVLEKIKVAATPPRFTQDFLATKLGLPGGTPKPVIPFLKRAGFLGTDGVPTDLYTRFRNPGESGTAAAEALKTAYQRLYELNEYVHDTDDEALRGLIVQATGLDANSTTVRSTVGSFKALKEFAEFDGATESEERSTDNDERPLTPPVTSPPVAHKLGLSYTINLNLPATSDIAVFDAIFKSLREHLLRS